MARPAARALAGYFPTPTHLIPHIAALLDRTAMLMPRKEYGRDTFGKLCLLDPCAGDGDALFQLAEALCGSLRPQSGPQPVLYAAELETERAELLHRRFARELPYEQRGNVLQADSFNITFEAGVQYTKQLHGAHLLYLNPPYDDDRDYGRLEHRFLVRFTPALAKGSGVLLYVVPFYALAASAEYIAREYQPGALYCYRFPGADWDAYKQVVLVAVRQAAVLPTGFDQQAAAKIRSWAADADSIPVLPTPNRRPVVALPYGEGAGFSKWQAASVDVQSLVTSLRPEVQTTKRGDTMPVRGLGLSTLGEMFAQPTMVAMPPRPAHLVTALAADFFNGAAVAPNDGVGAAGLIKARFTPVYTDVEEKVNNKGKVTKVVQVQQPQLNITFLDTNTGLCHRLKPGTQPTGERSPAKMTIADFVDGYSDSLLKVLDRMCPALHDPRNSAHKLRLPQLSRTLYEAQAHAVMAGLKLLYQNEDFILLGEIGSGKSSTSLAAAASLSPRNIRATLKQLDRQSLEQGRSRLKPVRVALIFCPPHLLASWQEQIRLTLPGAKVVVLDSTVDVERLGQLRQQPYNDAPGGDLVFALLSRESGKLGGRLTAGLDSRHGCPRCGTFVIHADEKIISQRLRCDYRPLLAEDTTAKLAVQLAELLAVVCPYDQKVRGLCRSRYLLRLGEKQTTLRFNAVADQQPDGELDEQLDDEQIDDLAASEQPAQSSSDPAMMAAWQERGTSGSSDVASTPLGKLLLQLTAELVRVLGDSSTREQARPLLIALVRLAVSYDHPQRDQFVAEVTRKLYAASLFERSPYGLGAEVRRAAGELLLTMSVGSSLQTRLVQELRTEPLDKVYGGKSLWEWVADAMNRLQRESRSDDEDEQSASDGFGQIRAVGGAITWRGYEIGDPEAARSALETLVGAGKLVAGEVCDEPLYAATASPRRYPLATYISRYRKHLVDMVIVDEAHEYAAEGSAQRLAAGRLVEMGKPTMLLTGSVMKGYASSLFTNFWAIDREFRREYGYHDLSRFVQTYGYLKREVSVEGKDDDKERSYGTFSDRKLDAERGKVIGLAPGVMPQFIVRLLRRAVTIDLDALGLDLPECRQIAVPVVPDEGDEAGREMLLAARALQQKVVERIAGDRFTPGLAGKLLYALPMVATYPDRCIVGMGRGVDDKGQAAFAIRYPADCGSKLVAAAPLFPAHQLTPKEQTLVRTVKAERAEGRRVIVYVWNSGEESGLVERLTAVLKLRAGVKVAVLDARKVEARERQAWIDREVIGKQVEVLIVNARAVETGLNNLVYFHTVVWFENPLCNAITFRQANGRVYRNGQQREVRIYILFYKDTLQAAMLSLWLQKVAESQKADGQDWQAALEAAGAGGLALQAGTFTLGDALFRKLREQEQAGSNLVAEAEGSGVMLLSNGPIVEVADQRPSTPPPALPQPTVVPQPRPNQPLFGMVLNVRRGSRRPATSGNSEQLALF